MSHCLEVPPKASPKKKGENGKLPPGSARSHKWRRDCPTKSQTWGTTVDVQEKLVLSLKKETEKAERPSRGCFPSFIFTFFLIDCLVCLTSKSQKQLFLFYSLLFPKQLMVFENQCFLIFLVPLTNGHVTPLTGFFFRKTSHSPAEDHSGPVYGSLYQSGHYWLSHSRSKPRNCPNLNLSQSVLVGLKQQKTAYNHSGGEYDMVSIKVNPRIGSLVNPESKPSRKLR